MKTCSLCKQLKPKSEFYFRKDRNCFFGSCKPCVDARNERNRQKNMDRVLHCQSLRRQTPEYRAKARARYAKNPQPAIELQRRQPKEKQRARNAINNAIRGGYLKRQPCEICGSKAEGHHPDYSDTLSVRWLCRKHHMDEHFPVRVVRRKTSNSKPNK